MLTVLGRTCVGQRAKSEGQKQGKVAALNKYPVLGRTCVGQRAKSEGQKQGKVAALNKEC